MKDTILINERNKLIRALRDKFIKDSTNYKSINNYVIDCIYNSKAPKYYISFDVCKRHISKIHKGDINIFKNEETRKMYFEIYNKWIIYIKENNLENDKQKFKYLDVILNSKASSFFVSKLSILRILYNK